MAKHIKTIFTLKFALIVLSAGILFTLFFQWAIQGKYLFYISNDQIIDAFQSADEIKLANIRKQYRLDYYILKKDKIIQSTDPFLPRVNPVFVSFNTGSQVLTNAPKKSLEHVLPTIVLRLNGLNIVFPLVFEETDRQYIIFCPIFP